MAMNETPVAIFDLDGTLVDSKAGILGCLVETLDRNHIPWSEPLDWFIGPPTQISMPRLMPNADESQRDVIVAEYRDCYGERGWMETTVYSGVREMLGALKAAGWKLFVCTSKREDFARKILERLELEAYFVALYGDQPLSKDHNKTELLGKLIEEQGLERSHCFMVGDRHFDVEAARANQLMVVAVTYGYGSEEELLAASPDAICRTTEEVSRVLLHRWAKQSDAKQV